MGLLNSFSKGGGLGGLFGKKRPEDEIQMRGEWENTFTPMKRQGGPLAGLGLNSPTDMRSNMMQQAGNEQQMRRQRIQQLMQMLGRR